MNSEQGILNNEVLSICNNTGYLYTLKSINYWFLWRFFNGNGIIVYSNMNL